LKQLLFISFSLIGLLGFSQTVNISGLIVNEEGQGIPSARIQLLGTDYKALADPNGKFNLTVDANQSYQLKAGFFGYFDQTKSITVKYVGISNLKIVLQRKTLKVIDVQSSRTGDMVEGLGKIKLENMASPTQNAEDFIKIVGLGVNSANELTANYNVRGGNYDENLIYVNGIEIYRPFLARSGQQEGLSFINSAFVENINFSSGGFDAYYGDKLSSVLDIRYREPNKEKLSGSAQASFMGGQAHIEGMFAGKRGNYITGARYRSNGYLLNSLPTQGDYNPTFFDYQFLSNFYLDYDDQGSSYKKLFVLGHYSNNNYRFEPATRTTNWGTVNEAYQLRVFFDGEEETKFQTFTAATGYEIKKNDKLKLTFVSSVFHSIESEHYDILAEYWINELETDPAKEEFGDSTSNVGIGGLLDHARNDLNVWIANAYLNGSYEFGMKEDSAKDKRTYSNIRFGGKVQYEHFNDRLSEWNLIDSAGYSIPLGASDEINLKEVIKQNNIVETYRATSYFQYSRNIIKTKEIYLDLKRKVKTDSTINYIYLKDTLNSPSKFSFTIGERLGYRFYNNELWFTPRASMNFSPRSYFINKDSVITRRNIKFRLASGLYFQPPLYRTMRGILGEINPDIVSQKSWHNVFGADVYFNIWDRPFKFITEAYYKYMWDVVPYEIDNVRIRYYGENLSVAYAYGIDAKINGEFVPGVESFFRIGYLNTKEDLLNDQYYLYFNGNGDTIVPGYTFDNTVVDSSLVEPGFIPRPTDQRLSFTVFFQDRMPKIENLKVSVSMTLGSALPYGPPTYERYKDVLRTKPYYRVDLGFMYDFINAENKDNFKERAVLKHFERFTCSLDAFNMLGINNVVSYQWLQDIAGNYYSIPNYLTGRRINLRFIVDF
jgi:hypothetical protein